MADNYLERKQKEYEEHKAAWLKKKKLHLQKPKQLVRKENQ